MTTEYIPPPGFPIGLHFKVTLDQDGTTKVVEHTIKLLKIDLETGKNRIASDDIQVTEKGLEAFKTFASLANIKLLSKGLRDIFLSAMKEDLWGVLWFEEFKEELRTLYDFLDDVEEEYGEPR